MTKLCILLTNGEITLTLQHPPEINPHIPITRDSVIFHEDDDEGVNAFVKYLDWDNVIAILQYPEEPAAKEADGNGKEAG